MASVTVNGKNRTATAQEAADAVRPLTNGIFSDGVTLTVADRRVYPIHGYWQVPLVPSHWPDRTSPLYEDIAIIEERLRANGIDDVVLALSDRL